MRSAFEGGEREQRRRHDDQHAPFELPSAPTQTCTQNIHKQEEFACGAYKVITRRVHADEFTNFDGVDIEKPRASSCLQNFRSETPRGSKIEREIKQQRQHTAHGMGMKTDKSRNITQFNKYHFLTNFYFQATIDMISARGIKKKRTCQRVGFYIIHQATALDGRDGRMMTYEEKRVMKMIL